MKKLLLASILLLSACSSQAPLPPTSVSPAEGICDKGLNPVCARVQVQCIAAPCDPVLETSPNPCTVGKNAIATTDGSCEADLDQACKNDSDCILSDEYASRKFVAKCLAKKCAVVRPN